MLVCFCARIRDSRSFEGCVSEWMSVRESSVFLTSWWVVFNQRLRDCTRGRSHRGSTSVLHTVQYRCFTVLYTWFSVMSNTDQVLMMCFRLYPFPKSRDFPKSSVTVRFCTNMSLLNWLSASARGSSSPSHVRLSLNKSTHKCLSSQNKLDPLSVPARVSGAGRGGVRVLEKRKPSRNTQHLLVGITERPKWLQHMGHITHLGF